MNILKRYDAYLTFSKIGTEQQEAIRSVMDKQGLDIDVCEDVLEFRFEGRDLSDLVTSSFAEIAAVLKEASGEIRCEINTDESADPTFRFLTISDSRLWLQTGKIVRSERREWSA